MAVIGPGGNGKSTLADAICETWGILADIVYPHELSELKKKAGGSYSEIGSAKCEWADIIRKFLTFT